MTQKASSRAPQGNGSIRKKTIMRNGKAYNYWEARFTIGIDPGSGKQIQRSITGKTQKEVAQKLKTATVAIDTGTYKSPCKMSVGEWLDIWQQEYLTALKPATLHIYKVHIEKHIKPAIGAVRLESLTPHAVQTFINRLHKVDDTGTLSPATIQITHAILSSAFKQAVRLGYIHSDPIAYCILPRKIKKEIRPLDEAQSKAFLSAIQGHPLEVLFTVDLFTGMRLGEILGLTWDCVDFVAGSITINKQLQRNPDTKEYGFTSPKSGRGRIITPAPLVMQLLKKHRAAQAELRLSAGPAWENRNLVFTNGVGRYLIDRVVFRMFKTVAESIGCPDLRFHDLRHSYAVASLRAGDDVKTLQENLGHSSATTTLNVYGHVTEQMKQASSQRMDSYIKAVLNL